MSPTVKLKIKCRIEEVPTIGRFLIESLNGDLADFTPLFPDFTPVYVTNAQTQLAAVEALINPRQETAELKVITLRILNNMAALPPKLDLLEGYIKRASGLTMLPKDFGISKVRKAVHRDDQEKTISELGILLANVNHATNLPLLQTEGYTPAQDAALQQIKTDLTNDNTAQNQKINARNNRVQVNYGVINSFWVTLTDISDTGKRVYRSSNKKDDYTMAELKRRIRNEEKKNKVAGTVTKQGGGAAANAKLVLTPVLGGRKRSTTSKASGAYELKSLTATDYILTVTLAGYITQNVAVTVVTGQTTTVDFVLVPV